jgi:hypothetical protein
MKKHHFKSKSFHSEKEKQYIRPASPFTYYTNFNKKVSEETQFYKTSNPQMFTWNLSH